MTERNGFLVGRIEQLNDTPISGALSVTALLLVEKHYNELRTLIDEGQEIKHSDALERVKSWRAKAQILDNRKR